MSLSSPLLLLETNRPWLLPREHRLFGGRNTPMVPQIQVKLWSNIGNIFSQGWMPEWQTDQGPTEGLGKDPLSARYLFSLLFIHSTDPPPSYCRGCWELCQPHFADLWHGRQRFPQFQRILVGDGYFQLLHQWVQIIFNIHTNPPTHVSAAQEKLNWAFKLYDIDNDGLVDQREMAIITETLDDIEGVKSGEPRGF